ncbi:MAG: hypothetical protein JSV19_11020, partial [Phycisphaerales bacterium]
MQPTNNANGGATLTARVGFWFGLALFVGVLALPPPASMHRAVRETFADEVKADVSLALARTGRADALPGSEAYRQAEARAVAERSRVMMAAAAVTALVACWWITVAVPIPVTSLLPLVLFPVVGVIP